LLKGRTEKLRQRLVLGFDFLLTQLNHLRVSIWMIDFLKQEILEHELQTKRVSDLESGNL